MEREFKFKLWHKESKKWIRDFFLWSDGDSSGKNGIFLPGMGTGDIHQAKQEEYIICQYTGLKDKKGKEIFEGDILLVKFNPEQILNREVIFRNSWLVKGILGEFDFNLSEVLHESELVGNIFENPELVPDKVNHG